MISRLWKGIAVLACASLAMHANAGTAAKFSSDTSVGTVVSFDWDGGDQGNLLGAMQYAANRNGNFAGVDTRRNQVNMFLVDFTTDTSGRYSGAGLTLFVMWGNDNAPSGPFVADVDVSPPITEAADNGTFDGMPHIFALGTGVTIDDSGPVTVDIDVDNNQTPVGYAITNLFDFPTSVLNTQFTLAQAIRKVRLLGPGGKVWQGVDDDGDGTIFTDGIVLSVIPAPAALGWGLAGLAGLGLAGSRRRRTVA